MKSGKTVFPPRFYINICEEENPWIHRNPIRYEKSVTPATLVDNQCFVVKLPGFSFHTSCICSFLLILWLNLCKRLHFDKTERNNTLKSDKTKRNECSHINIFIEENIEKRGQKPIFVYIYSLNISAVQPFNDGEQQNITDERRNNTDDLGIDAFLFAYESTSKEVW